MWLAESPSETHTVGHGVGSRMFGMTVQHRAHPQAQSPCPCAFFSRRGALTQRSWVCVACCNRCALRWRVSCWALLGRAPPLASTPACCCWMSPPTTSTGETEGLNKRYRYKGSKRQTTRRGSSTTQQFLLCRVSRLGVKSALLVGCEPRLRMLPFRLWVLLQVVWHTYFLFSLLSKI